jgi:hypothetical protein
MQKWLVFFLALAAVLVFTQFNSKKNRERHPRLKRLNQSINIVVWVIVAAYATALIIWLLKK